MAPSITTNDITATAGEQITLTANINDGDKQINTGKVLFKINGKTIKDANGKVLYVKVVNGIASLNYTIPSDMNAKNYNITAIFTSPNYEKLEDTKTLTVNQNVRTWGLCSNPPFLILLIKLHPNLKALFIMKDKC